MARNQSSHFSTSPVRSVSWLVPLVTSKRYFAAGFGISWIFAESSTRVAVPDVGKAR